MTPRTFKQQFIPKHSSIELKPEGIVLHETATPGATAEAEFKFFSRYTKANAHAFIDWFQDLQIIPWNRRAWHCGPTGNSKYIGVEMCHPKGHDPEKFIIVYWASVDAVARLFRFILKTKVVTSQNLRSHKEVSQEWKESTHVDPISFLAEYGKTMEGFRADVQYRLDEKWRA